MQTLGNVASSESFTGQPQHLAFAFVERVGLRPGFQCQFGSDRATAPVHLAQHFGELFGRRILQ